VAVAQERGDEYAHTIALGQLAIALAQLGDFDRSAQVAAEGLTKARLLSTPYVLAGAVGLAATSYLSTRADPDFEGGIRLLQDNPVDLDAAGGIWAEVIFSMWGLAHLGLGHTGLALGHLIRTFRLADRIGLQARLGEEVFAIAVALAEAGQLTLAWQLIGYSQAHFRDSPVRNRSRDWLQALLANLETTADTTERDSALTAGARLDRRGFMRLLAQAENNAERIAETP
jgi:hypothetical protein